MTLTDFFLIECWFLVALLFAGVFPLNGKVERALITILSVGFGALLIYGIYHFLIVGKLGF